MRHTPIVRLIAALALAASIAPLSAGAAPLEQTNLLTNPGFEGGFYAQSGNGDLTVGNGWSAWHEDSGGKPNDGTLNYVLRPKWSGENNQALVHGGAWSQHVGNFYDPWHGGVMQTVTAPAGSRVRLTAFGYIYTSNDNYPANDSGVDGRMQIGIDPSGSGLWYASGMVWSGTLNPHLAWQSFSVETTVGSAGKVTVYLSNNFRGGTSLHLDAWWDDVSLTVLDTATAAPNVPTATSAPVVPVITPFTLPTPMPDGRIVYTVKPGDSMWHIAAVAGLTVEQLKAMNNLTSTVVSVGQQLVIGQVTPAEPPTPVPTATLEGPPPTETPTPAPVLATGTGEVCVLLYDDANGNGLRDSGEGLVAGGQFTVTDPSGAPVDGYTTTGAETEAECFEQLAEGSYTIGVGIPAGYNPTTSTNYPLPLQKDSVVNLEFGAQKSGDTGATQGGVTGGGRLQTALFGAAGVVFLLLAAGVGGFLVLSRRR